MTTWRDNPSLTLFLFLVLLIHLDYLHAHADRYDASPNTIHLFSDNLHPHLSSDLLPDNLYSHVFANTLQWMGRRRWPWQQIGKRCKIWVFGIGLVGIKSRSDNIFSNHFPSHHLHSDLLSGELQRNYYLFPSVTSLHNMGIREEETSWRHQTFVVHISIILHNLRMNEWINQTTHMPTTEPQTGLPTPFTYPPTDIPTYMPTYHPTYSTYMPTFAPTYFYYGKASKSDRHWDWHSGFINTMDAVFQEGGQTSDGKARKLVSKTRKLRSKTRKVEAKTSKRFR